MSDRRAREVPEGADAGDRGPSPSLRDNVAWTLLGNGVYQAAQWGILIVLTKLTSQEDVGDFVLALAVTAPVFLFTSLQLRAVQAVDALRQRSLGEYVALRMLTICAALFAVGVIVAAGYRTITGLLIVVWALAKAFESMSDILLGFMQQAERFDLIAKSQIIKGVTSLASLGIIVYATHNAILGVTGLAVVWAWRLVTYDMKKARMLARAQLSRVRDTSIRPVWNYRVLAKMGWRALPLGVVVMITSLYYNVPRYAVSHYLGADTLALFGATAYLTLAGSMIANALTYASAPRLAKHYTRGERRHFLSITGKLLIGVVGVGAISMIIAAAAGRQLLTLFYNSNYAGDVNLLIWLMGGGLLTYAYTILEGAMTAAHFFRIQLVISMSVLLAAISSAFLMVPAFGVVGGAYSMVIGGVIGVVASAAVVLYSLRRLKKDGETEAMHAAVEPDARGG